MDRILRLLVIAAAAGLIAAGCGASDEGSTSCVRANDAEVCGQSSKGSVRISAQGLLPGSDLLLDPAGMDPQVLEVGDDGRPVGATGFLGGAGSGPLVIAVSGTAADGSEISGEIVGDRA
jgi:hypothetical protein